jgi:hypothetical protein
MKMEPRMNTNAHESKFKEDGHSVTPFVFIRFHSWLLLLRLFGLSSVCSPRNLNFERLEFAQS